MLGGLSELHKPDICDSEVFLKKLIEKHNMGTDNVAEIGSGIGRVSLELQKILFLLTVIYKLYLY